MPVIKRKHISLLFSIIIPLFLYNCSFNVKKDNHGLTSLNTRGQILVLKKSNKNDVIKLIGKPHTKSIENENKWIYFERRVEKGKFHKLGKNILTENNVLELNFDKYGVLVKKNIINIDDMNKIKTYARQTENNVKQQSAIAGFLSSVKQKMYNKKKKTD